MNKNEEMCLNCEYFLVRETRIDGKHRGECFRDVVIPDKDGMVGAYNWCACYRKQSGIANFVDNYLKRKNQQIELPCSIGSYFYAVNKNYMLGNALPQIIKCKVTKIMVQNDGFKFVDECGDIHHSKDIGDYLFYSEEDAKNKAKEVF